IFSSRVAAEGAVDELWDVGFRHGQVGMATPGEAVHEATTVEGELVSRAALGASTGAAAGGAVGALLGAAGVALVARVVPGGADRGAGAGVGGGLARGAAAGAAVGTFLGPFVAMGVAKGEALAHRQDLAAGHTLVVVRAEGRLEEAVAVLRSHGPIEIRMPGE